MFHKPYLSNLLYTRFVWVMLVFMFCASSVKATHIIGGNMGYEYLGLDSANPGNHKYKVNLDVYLDCSSPGWVGNGGFSFPERIAQVGIFEGPFAPTTQISYTQSLNLVLSDSNQVEGNLPVTCNTLNLISSLCVYLIHYEEEISLPASSLGYWIVNDRCCRPGGILNIVNSGTSPNTFTTWIPAQNGGLIANSSPQFTDTLVTYICSGDTATISNAAIDPDGDSLVYSLETPFSGHTSNITPATAYTNPILNPYTIPPPTMAIPAGYGLTSLLGPGSVSTINGTSGLTTFSTTGIGKYVASVEIKEYRAGQLVGISRRNMQLVCDNCPNNTGPDQDVSNLDPSAITPISYQVNAGDSVCFNLDYSDTDNDPLLLIASGDIFNPSLTLPAAQTNAPVVGTGNVTGTFCWNTSCAQGRVAPYDIRVVVSDSNCPPLPITQTISIFVRPFVGPSKIYGDSIICVNANRPSSFSADTLSNINYNWSVTGGNIISGMGTPNISVSWTPGQTSAIVTLTGSNSVGCSSPPIQYNVVLDDVTADAGVDRDFCIGEIITLGGGPTTNNLSNIISWTPAIGLSNPNAPNPTVTPNSTTTYVVNLASTNGCTGSDTVTVSANSLVPSEILPEYFLCPGDTLQLFAVGDSFSWTPNLFISDTSISNPLFFPPSNQTYFLQYFDVNGCEGNDTVEIGVNGTIPTNAGLDIFVCDGDSAILGGNPTGPPGTSYLWSPNNSINNDTLSNPKALATVNTIYTVITTNDTCTGIDSVSVILRSLPLLTLSADTFLCEGDTTQIFAFGLGSISWNNGNTLSDTNIFSPLAFPTQPTWYTATLQDVNSCFATDSIFVDIKPLPFANAGLTVKACKLLPAVLGGNPTGPSQSTFLWLPNTQLNFNQLANPLVTTENDITYTVQVTDSSGCVSFDSVAVEVFRIFGSLDTTLCDDQVLQLNTTSKNGALPFRYAWQPAKLVSDSTLASPTIVTGSANSFFVVSTDSNNCRDTATFTINSLAPTEAIFDYNIEPACTGVGVKITESSTGALAYNWLVNDEFSSNEANPTLVFPYKTTATITLITTSADGCFDTASVQITGPSFDELAQVKVSNVFTPNGDGINDYFEITTNGNLGSCVEVSIYNRDGALVHQSYGGVHIWDGRSDTGQPFPDGVYFYVYKINGMEYKGNVSLLRSL